MKWSESLAPLKGRTSRWHYASVFVNTAGATMASIALAFAVLDIEDSASAVGQVLAARSIPLVIFLLIGGVLADRMGRARLIQISNIASAASQAVAAFLVITGHAELWHLIVLESVNGTTSAASFPALQGLIPQLVDRRHLQQANALLSLSRGSMRILGPSLGAVLVVTAGPGWALAIDAACWLLAALFLLPIKIPPRAPTGQTSSVVADLKEGWDFFRGTTWLWVVVAGFGLLNMIHAGAWFTLGPTIADDTVGRQGWGLAVSAESIGLLLMTVVMLKVSFRYPLRSGMLGMMVFAAPLFVLGVDPQLWPLLIASFAAGAGIEVFSIGWNLAMQENIDESMLSRAYSYDALGSFVAIPVGQLLYGPLADWIGVRELMVISAIAYAAISLLVLASRDVRNLERTPQEPHEDQLSTTSAPAP